MTKLAHVAILMTVTMSLSLATASQAAGPRRWRRPRVAVPAKPAATIPARRAPSWRLYSPYGPVQYDYSKYYGGFHSRYFLEDWYPTGDRPVRGTAW